MAKTRRPLLGFILSICMLSACGGNEVSNSSGSSTTELSFSTDAPTTMTVGETVAFADSLIGSEEAVTWAVDDPLIAEIDTSGNLKGLRNGVVEVRAISTEDSSNKATLYVTVSNRTGITVNVTQSVSTLKVGSTAQFKASVEGDSDSLGVTWYSSNTALAKVDATGLVTARQVGKVVITASSNANPEAKYNVSLEIQADDSGNTSSGEIESKNGYKLVFEDSFEGNWLNSNNWEVMQGDGSNYTGAGWGNGEQEFYRAENLKPVDGILNITAKRADSNKNKGMPYTSGRIRSYKKVAFAYGRIEAKISCPFGNGLWPAFWMLPDTEGLSTYGGWPNSGEIDIMEAKGRVKYSVDGTIHFADTNGDATYTNGTYVMPDNEDINGYHVYAVEWDEGQIRWYVDDQLYFTADATKNTWTMKTGTGTFPAPFDKPFHLLLNLAVGGNYDGYKMPSENEVPAVMKIDYVKWYQK